MYYKILNEKLYHNSFQYKEGLNEDTIPFNPIPKCGKGGLFFADINNILVFMDFGTKIANVSLPEGENVVKVTNCGIEKYKAHRIILSNIRDLYCIDTINDLIAHGLNLKKDGDEMLIHAAINGRLDIIKHLEKLGASIENVAFDMLSHAAEHNYNNIIFYVIEHIKKNDNNEVTEIAAIWAIENGFLNILKLLVESGVKVDRSLLLCAVENGQLEIIKYLVKLGLPIKRSDTSLLRLAVRYGYIDVVKYLVESGINIHVNEEIALREAALYGQIDIVKYLVGLGADIHACKDKAVMNAVVGFHLNIVKYLIEVGANIHTKQDFALRYATRYHYLNIVEYLSKNSD